MKVPFADLSAQYASIKSDIDRVMSEVIARSSFVGGSYVERFESDFAAFCNAQYCVGTGNGTDALYIALRSLGVGPGDEVITVANSFIATSEAVTLTGAKPVFVDCSERTFNIFDSGIEHAITPRTKAILPVHLFGKPANMPAIMTIAARFNLLVVEDAAQAHGARLSGNRVGTFGHAACFSFYPGKNLGAYGDGGAIVTNDRDLARKCRMTANHGRAQKYEHDFEGVNSRLDGLQAAILNVKLKHLDRWNESRRKNATLYRKYIQTPSIICPEEDTESECVYHLYVVRVPNRDAVQARLAEKGISTGIHYPVALPNLKAYRYLGHRPEDFPVATRFSGEILSLPMFPELTESQIEYVCRELEAAVISTGV